MPEAVMIVAAARSPIGRAARARSPACGPTTWPSWSVPRWTRSPRWIPTEIDDLMLGCGLPGGEQGNNLGRVVAVLLGLDTSRAPR